MLLCVSRGMKKTEEWREGDSVDVHLLHEAAVLFHWSQEGGVQESGSAGIVVRGGSDRCDGGITG